MELTVLVGSFLFLVTGYFVSYNITKRNINVKSSVDHRVYSVRSDVQNAVDSADTLAKLYQRMVELSHHLDPNNIYHKRILKRIHTIVIKENPLVIPPSSLTSYTINKGEEIVLCLREPKTQTLHTIDKLTYVMIHEMAHIGCPEVGHTALFKEVFTDLLKIAVFKAAILQKTDYATSPDSYCGITISERLL
jgi:hypothetical protein